MHYQNLQTEFATWAVKNISTQKNSQEERWKCWEPPTEGWIKLNADGAEGIVSQTSCAGGLLRRPDGSWVAGFSQHIKPCPIDYAELWGVLTGIRIAISQGIQKLHVETDSIAVFELLSNTTVQKVLNPLAISCLQLRNYFLDFRTTHILREANGCADKLAKLGRSLSMGTTTHTRPPHCIQHLLQMEAANLVCLRFKNANFGMLV